MTRRIRIYTGIGSRSTPSDILVQIHQLGALAAESGLVLYSGGADGADAFFERGHDYYWEKFRDKFKEDMPNKCIFLPWKGFNNNPSSYYNTHAECFELARITLGDSHWDNLSVAGKKLHARNIHQILGPDLATKTELVICWTPGVSVKGGTATALKLASHLGIPILNLADEGALVRAKDNLLPF